MGCFELDILERMHSLKCPVTGFLEACVKLCQTAYSVVDAPFRVVNGSMFSFDRSCNFTIVVHFSSCALCFQLIFILFSSGSLALTIIAWILLHRRWYYFTIIGLFTVNREQPYDLSFLEISGASFFCGFSAKTYSFYRLTSSPSTVCYSTFLFYF